MISCASRTDDPDVVIERMVKAHGGSAMIQRIQSYVGRGFMKNLQSKSVVQSDPFDIFRRGPLYKNRIVRLREGNVTDIGITIFDGSKGYQWRAGAGRSDVAAWQFEMLQYLFPQVLEWVQGLELAGEIVTSEHEYYIERIRYVSGDDIITIAVDDRTWLLKEVRVASVSDSAFSFSEGYDNYREVEGVPFPGRFMGEYKDNPYYEYFIPVIEFGVELPDSVFTVTAEDTVDIFEPDTLQPGE